MILLLFQKTTTLLFFGYKPKHLPFSTNIPIAVPGMDFIWQRAKEPPLSTVCLFQIAFNINKQQKLSRHFQTSITATFPTQASYLP
jgi:hypothetical protein